MIAAPLLSEYDPIDTSEGSLDPLGLAAIAEQLASQLVPGVRERQARPRYLTAMAVSAVVCSKFGEDQVATDGISPPWQVFEWYMVEGLSRTSRKGKELYRLPGSDKAAQALKRDIPLGAANYLKSPQVFGFHGVYRVLADDLDIVASDRLGETGYRLIDAWEMDHDQDLRGFQSNSAAHPMRKQLVDAIVAGLDKKCTNRSGAWTGWQFFADYLVPDQMGRRERAVLRSALLDDQHSLRRQVLHYLSSQAGQTVWRETESERDFHRGMSSQANAELKMLLRAIQKYEAFSRLLQNAFDDCLAVMTKQAGRTTPCALTPSKSVAAATRQIPVMFRSVSDTVQPFLHANEFEESFARLADRAQPDAWVSALLEHHIYVQRAKPPIGKSPWFERYDNGDVYIRPLYRRDKGSDDQQAYVHRYRTRTLSSFVRDLRMVK